jgi:hypothetical protein
MEFYYFGGVMGDTNSLKTPSKLEAHHFSGVMFTHDIPEGDMFVKTAVDVNPNEKIKYLVAIRPYTISPQYLSMINQSLDRISRDRLQINLISGYIKDHESNVGGIVGPVTDGSNHIDRSNYLIKFLQILDEMEQKNSKTYHYDPEYKNKLDLFVSVTNKFSFTEAKKYNKKIIFPYSMYSRGTWTDHRINPAPPPDDNFDLSGIDVMLALTPIIRKTKEELEKLTDYAMRPVWKKGEIPAVVGDVGYFTYEEFDDFVQTLEKKGINYLLLNAVPGEEAEVIIPFIKQYVETRNVINKNFKMDHTP